MTGKDVVRRLLAEGWELDRISGSHHIFKKGKRTVTVPVHGSKDLKAGTLNNIQKQAGWKP